MTIVIISDFFCRHYSKNQLHTTDVCISLTRNDNYSRFHYVKYEKRSLEVMENLTQRLIILDINTIKRTTQKVIKEKPNKILRIERAKEEKIEKHMAVDRAIQQLNQLRNLNTKTSFNLHLHFLFSNRRKIINEKRDQEFFISFIIQFMTKKTISVKLESVI